MLSRQRNECDTDFGHTLQISELRIHFILKIAPESKTKALYLLKQLKVNILGQKNWCDWDYGIGKTSCNMGWKLYQNACTHRHTHNKEKVRNHMYINHYLSKSESLYIVSFIVLFLASWLSVLMLLRKTHGLM